MSNPSRGLGRGLASLLGGQMSPSPASNKNSLPLNAIQPGPSQPRRTIQPQPLEELAASIRANGVIQPIVVRPIANTTGYSSDNPLISRSAVRSMKATAQNALDLLRWRAV